MVAAQELHTTFRIESKELEPFDDNHRLELHFSDSTTSGIDLEAANLTNELDVNHGFSTWWASGNYQGDRGLCIPELSYQSAENQELNNALFDQSVDQHSGETWQRGLELRAQVVARAEKIHQQLRAYIIEHRIGVVQIRNIKGLPLNLAASLAIHKLEQEFGDQVLFITHTADFVWEAGRAERWTSPYSVIQSLVERLPASGQENKGLYLVINSLAQQELMQRYGIKAEVVTDSYDFSEPTVFERIPPEVAAEMRERMGLRENDLIIGYAARVVPRKGIELGLQVAAHLEVLLRSPEMQAKIEAAGGRLEIFNGVLTPDSRVVFAFMQDQDLRDSQDYFDSLHAYNEILGGQVELVNLGRFFRANKNRNQVERPYQFYDALRVANTTVYPSLAEGFGNQLLEIVGNGLVPAGIYRYPVFESDIKSVFPDDQHYIAINGRLSQFKAREGRTKLHAVPAQAVAYA